MRRSGLRLEAEAVGQGPAPRFDGLQQTVLWVAAVGIFDRRVDLVEEGEFVEIALRVHQSRLVQRVARVQGDGAGHRIRPRVMQPGEQHIAHKDLLSLGDVEDHVFLAPVGGSRLLFYIDLGLVEATAQVVGQQRVAVSGQILRRKQLARRGVQQREELAVST